MAQEEHIRSSSHSGSGGGDSGGGGVSSDRSKNVKQKKVPQRGLGVAQLEKIRLEEQRKREALQAANVLANNAVGSVNDLALQCPSFVPSLSPSPNPLHRSSGPSVPNPTTNQLNGDGADVASQAISSPGNGNWSRLLTGEYNVEGDKQRIDYLGVSFRPPPVNFPYELNAPLPGVPQRSYGQFQQPSSSVVNASSGISSTVSSSQMEPPSNQSVHGNNYTSSWREEYETVGMKRSYPFSLESAPARSFPINFGPTSAASKSRSDELHSCSSGYTPQTEPRNQYMRDGPSNPILLPEQNADEAIRDDGRLNGNYLTLAPPTAALSALDSKLKHPFDYSGPQGSELSEFKTSPSQENLKSQIDQLEPSSSKEQPFSFFPVKLQTEQTTSHGEKEETIDLNLKL